MDIPFVPCHFQDPLCVIISPDQTVKTHNVGGVLLQSVKEHRLHWGFVDTDSVFYDTCHGSPMWYWTMTALASRVSIVLFDGPLSGVNLHQYGVTVIGADHGMLFQQDVIPIEGFSLCQPLLPFHSTLIQECQMPADASHPVEIHMAK